MQDSVVVSILVCTVNRAAHLAQALNAIAAVNVPEGLSAELIVIDNGSTDGTAGVVDAFAAEWAEGAVERESAVAEPAGVVVEPAGVAAGYAEVKRRRGGAWGEERAAGQKAGRLVGVRRVFEPRRGKGHAYNSGIAAARGRVLVFTDDDVHPPVNWIEGMAGPIARGEADVMAGAVKIAPELLRPWMVEYHRVLMASTEHLQDGGVDAGGIVGANMAFARTVFETIPGFDPEIGPGALGMCDDTLIYRQAKEAGYRIRFAGDVVCEHRFDPSRLKRQVLLEHARKQGRSLAYVAHHWEHAETPMARAQWAKASLRLALWRWRRRGDLAGEGTPDWEMKLLSDVAFYEQYLREKKRARNYALHGLVKRAVG
jgi:glycosyltransferase involved in cell wall biosynthesis